MNPTALTFNVSRFCELQLASRVPPLHGSPSFSATGDKQWSWRAQGPASLMSVQGYPRALSWDPACSQRTSTTCLRTCRHKPDCLLMTLQYTTWYRHWKTIISCNKTSSGLLSGRRAGTWPFIQRSAPRILPVTRARRVLKYPYQRQGYTLETLYSVKYLGFIIKKDLSWNSHNDNICARAKWRP